MEFNKVILNSTVLDYSKAISFENQSEIFLYEDIHLKDGKALHLAYYLKLLRQNYAYLYSKEWDISEQRINQELSLLLKANYINQGSYQLRIILWQNKYILVITSRLLYNGFTLWHYRLKGVLFDGRDPLEGMKSSLSLSFANLLSTKLDETRIAIIKNLEGEITSAASNNIYAIKDTTVYSSSKIEPWLAKAIDKAGYKFVQSSILGNEINNYQELFFTTTQGITSINRLDDKVFHCIATGLIAEML